MIINKKFDETIKFKDLAYVNDLGCEVIEYYPSENCIHGKVYVTGAYHSTKTDEVKLISEDLDFEIELDNNEFYIEDIECVSFDYQVLESCGLKVEFEIKLEVDVTEDFDIRDETVLENLEIENEFEEFKEKVTSKVDQKLLEKLEIIDDNNPQIDGIFRCIKDEINTFKVVYFNDEKELLESIVKDKMENCVKLAVPFKVSSDYGTDWYEAK